jgi:hypothetical protein
MRQRELITLVVGVAARPLLAAFPV